MSVQGPRVGNLSVFQSPSPKRGLDSTDFVFIDFFLSDPPVTIALSLCPASMSKALCVGGGEQLAVRAQGGK